MNEIDPFSQGRRPFWTAAIGVALLALIAWANGWIRFAWE